MNPHTIQAILAPCFLLMGLSHVVQPRMWVRFFAVVEQTGLASAIIPIYTLPIALVLVVGHNVWVWDWPVFLTIAGWLMLIKCAIYLLVPGITDRVVRSKVAKSPSSYQLVGAIMTLFGAVLTWQSWTRNYY